MISVKKYVQIILETDEKMLPNVFVWSHAVSL